LCWLNKSSQTYGILSFAAYNFILNFIARLMMMGRCWTYS